jgi:hypothetical protein
VFERFQHDWNTTKRIIKQTVGNTIALIDSTGVGDGIVEDLQQTCPNIEGFKFTSESKQRIMEALAVSIQDKSIKIIGGVLQDELESFEYIYSSRGVKYSAPTGLHDDTVCALALANYKHLKDFKQTFIGIW